MRAAGTSDGATGKRRGRIARFGERVLSYLRDRVSTTEQKISLSLLAFAVGFNLYALRSEVQRHPPPLNDNVMDLLLFQKTGEALSRGWDPVDFWLRPVGMGFPLFHYKQHLGYVLPAVFNYLLPGSISPQNLLSWTIYLLLALFPISIYWSMRRVGFSALTCGCAALIAPLISTDGLYGLDFASYVWRGWGMYTQLWASVLLPPAIAEAYVSVRDGRRYLGAAVLVAATTMANLIYGYIAVVSVLLLVVLTPTRKEVLKRSRRAVVLLGTVAVTLSYFVMPLLLDRAYLNRGVWDNPQLFDSFGASWVMKRLVDGDMFDFDRLPVLTALGAVGIAACLWRWKQEIYRLPLALLVVWLAFYFGRPTWGPLIDLLPMGHDLYLHRMIGGVHLAGILLIGIGLSWPLQWALRRKRAWYPLGAGAAAIVMLLPVYKERLDYLSGNTEFMQYNEDTYHAQEADISALVTTLNSDGGTGRVYAGFHGNWGGDYLVGNIPMYSILNTQGVDTLGYLYNSLSFNGDVQYTFDENRREDYDIFNVRFVVAPAGHVFPDFVKPLRTFGRNQVFTVDTGGYFDLVDSGVGFRGGQDDFYPAAVAWKKTDLPAAGQYPAMTLDDSSTGFAKEYPMSAAPGIVSGLSANPGTSRGRILSQTFDDQKATAVAVVERDTYLLLRVTYSPGWHAYVDDHEVDTTMLMPSYEAVRLTPGSHLVRFEYTSSSLKHWLGVLGLAGLVGVGLWQWRGDALTEAARRRWRKVPFEELIKRR